MGLLGTLLARLRPAPLPVITPQALAARLRTRPAPFLLDVRGPDEFSGPLGHIGGAVNLPLPRLLATPAAQFSGKAAPIVLICLHGPRARMAARHLLKAGLADVSVLEGGMARWRALRLPTA